MSDRRRSPVGQLRRELGSLAGDLKQMAADRWELARLEGREAVGPIRRLAIWLAVAAVVLLVGLSTLTAAAAVLYIISHFIELPFDM